MARPKTRETETITFRLPKETKERIIAAALRYEDVNVPSDVNVSDVIRDVLAEWLDQFELQQGGREVLAERLRSARKKEAEALLAELGP